MSEFSPSDAGYDIDARTRRAAELKEALYEAKANASSPDALRSEIMRLRNGSRYAKPWYKSLLMLALGKPLEQRYPEAAGLSKSLLKEQVRVAELPLTAAHYGKDPVPIGPEQPPEPTEQ